MPSIICFSRLTIWIHIASSSGNLLNETFRRNFQVKLSFESVFRWLLTSCLVSRFPDFQREAPRIVLYLSKQPFTAELIFNFPFFSNRSIPIHIAGPHDFRLLSDAMRLRFTSSCTVRPKIFIVSHEKPYRDMPFSLHASLSNGRSEQFRLFRFFVFWYACSNRFGFLRVRYRAHIRSYNRTSLKKTSTIPSILLALLNPHNLQGSEFCFV